jgi:serine/threonine protein kinase
MASFVPPDGTDGYTPAADGPDGRIGPYKLLQLLGKGGMGAVYVAEQEHPVKRRVAVKLIKPGMDSEGVVARFAAEQQALALMDHTNIARVFEAGTTEAGRPYFVMELIGGVPITRYCDELHLTIRERLGLFVPVCQAIQHAHQKGVIHRDVKPGNVLVAMQDGKPIPKVIDFGVAKALHQPLTDRTVYTEFGAVVGTLEYMAPEQAELSPLGVDTRADVYALGVLLYELLTGATPFDRKRLRAAPPTELLRILKEEDPPRPSTRLTESKESLATLAARRRTDPQQLAREVRGDLDWIVMKALEKDRTRRYETANGLARDVERFLADEPVEARPPSAAYRLQKLARRHRAWFAGAAVVALLLVAATAVSAWLAIRATRAEDQARALLKAEEQARAEAEAVRDFFVNDMIGWAGPDRKLGLTVTVDKVLEGAERSVAARFAGQPLQEAAARSTLGRVYREMGQYPKSEGHLRRARELYAEHHGPRHRRTVETMNHLALTLHLAGQDDEAGTVATEAGEIARREFGPEDTETLWADYYLALVRGWAQARGAEAESLLRRVLEVRRRVSGEDHRATLWARGDLGTLLAMRGKLDEGQPLLEEALQARRRVFGQDHPDCLVAETQVGMCFLARGQWAEAQRRHREVLERSRRVNGADHPRTNQARSGLAFTLALPAAPEHQDLPRALELCDEVAARQDPNPITSAQLWSTRGMIRYRQRDWEAALTALERSEEMSRGRLTNLNGFFAAMACWEIGQKERAREWYRRAVRQLERDPDPVLTHPRAEAEARLGIHSMGASAK